MKTQTARQRLLASTMIGGVAAMAMMAAPAFAQDESEATEVTGVVVTGSRIVRQDFEAISPVTTVGSEQLELTATLTVDSLLNELPQIVPGNTRTSNNSGGEDFSTIDLRGLGTQRTLVLVNGERIPGSSTTGVVDLNTIPASLVDRIEVVTGGASAVYGSDAIAGVVNFILKDDYEGAELTMTYGSGFDGNAPEFEANFLVGGNFANGRGNATAYAAYYSRDSVMQSEFARSRNSAGICYNTSYTSLIVCDSAAEVLASGGLVQPGGSATSPWGTISNNPANPFTGLGALLPGQFGAGNADTNCDGIPNVGPVNGGNLSFDDDGNLVPLASAGACGVPDRAAGSSRYNFAPDNMLIIPAERFNMTTTVTYDFTDNLRGKFMLNYVNSQSEVQLAATPATGLTVTLTPNMVALINANAPDLAVALASRPNPTAPFTMAYRTNSVGTRNAQNENNSFFMLATLDGDFNDNWNWSVTASHGSNKFVSSQFNSVNATAFRQGLAGCQDTSGAPLGVNALPGCVPLDIFGPNTLTPEMVDFLRVNTFSTTDIDESRIAGFVRGDLFELPAGPIAAVVGFEYRESSVEFRVDNEQSSGNIYGFNAIQNISGSVNVTELYGEVSVPLVRDQPFFHYLGFEAGYRYSDYSSIGGVETFKVGGEWAPVDFLRFRGMYNEATRAPSAIELFQAGDQGFPGYVDPCNNNLTGGPDLTPAQIAFCTAQAGGTDFFSGGFSQNNSQVEAFAFGNPDLAPETSNSLTLGVVFQPDWWPVGDFRATADYYDIKIEDAVGTLGAQFWINSCFQAANLADPACARVVRDPVTGQVDFVNTTIGNLNEIATNGWDFQFEWTVNLEDTFLGVPGRLRVNELFSLIDEYSINGTNFIGTTTSSIGGGLFDWKSTLSVYYMLGDWTAFVRWSYVPGLCDTTFGATGTERDCNNFATGFGVENPAASYVDASVRWNVTDSFQVTGFIGNLFDEEAPQTVSGALFGQGNTDAQMYRPLGRTFSISAKFRF